MIGRERNDLQLAARLCLLIVSFVAPNSLVAATAVQTWVRSYNGPANSTDFATAVAVGPEGNVYVTGESYAYFPTYDDIVTLAYSSSGVALWTNRYATAHDDRSRAIAVDSHGNVFVVGGGWGYLTVAYSAAGMVLWANQYLGPAGSTSDQATALALSTNGTVYVTGFSQGTNSSSDYATIAYSNSGVPLWTNQYNGPGNGSDDPIAIAVGPSGNIYVTGTDYGGAGTSWDYATIAYSSAGVPLWTNRYDGPGHSQDEPAGLAIGPEENVYVTGESTSMQAVGDYDDFATIAYSKTGVPLWTNRYGPPDNHYDVARAVVAGANGNVYVTGDSQALAPNDVDYATIAYTSTGTPLWTNRYSGPTGFYDHVSAAALDANGNLFVTGTSWGRNATNSYFFQFGTVTYAPSGQPLWTNRFDGPLQYGKFQARPFLAADPQGAVYLAASCDGDTGRGSGGIDVLVVKYAPAPSIRFTALEALSNSAWRLTINAPTNISFRLEASSNLLTWLGLTSFSNLASGSIQFTDATAPSLPRRFYRARWLP